MSQPIGQAVARNPSRQRRSQGPAAEEHANYRGDPRLALPTDAMSSRVTVLRLDSPSCPECK